MSGRKQQLPAVDENDGIHSTGRREALRNMALLMAGALSASTFSILVDGCNTPAAKSTSLFTARQQELVAAIADTIIPDTDTPGAKATGTGPFITMMLEECYPKEVQDLFLKGLTDTDGRAEKMFGAGFIKLTAPQQHALLKQIADDTIALKKAHPEKQAPPYFFQLIRELTLLGYFTSKTGTTQALVYVPVPGRYNGNIPLQPGQKAWAL